MVKIDLKELRKKGYSVRELKENGYDVKYFKDAGYTLKELKNDLFVKKYEYYGVYKSLENINYGIADIDFFDSSREFSVEDLKNGGYTLQDFKDAKYTTREIKRDFSLKELKDDGYTLQDFKFSNNMQINELKQVFSLKDFKEGDYSLKYLVYNLKVFNDGFSLKELKEEFTLKELKDVGYYGENMKEMFPYRLKDFKNYGFSEKGITNFFPLKELKEEFTLKELKEEFTLKELVLLIYNESKDEIMNNKNLPNESKESLINKLKEDLFKEYGINIDNNEKNNQEQNIINDELEESTNKIPNIGE